MATHLKVGDKAPAFSGKDHDGKKISLSDYKGSNVVLYFYPADDTPACTTQSCNLRDNYKLFQKQGYNIIGISPDDVESHMKFSLKYSLPFPLIADPQLKIIEKYGVWGEKNLYGRKFMGLHRTTFIINEEGIIEKIFLRPRTKIHSEEILK
jgi:thioredoxin-dependent peroxiredoxin